MNLFFRRTMACVLMPLLLLVLVVRPVVPSIASPLPASTVSTFTSAVIRPVDLTVDGQGNIIVLSFDNNAVYRVAASGRNASLVAGSGTNAGTGFRDGIGSLARFNRSIGITCNANTNVAYVSDSGNNLIRVLDLTTQNVTTLTAASKPYGIVVHPPLGLLYVAAITDRSIIRIVIATGASTTLATTSSHFYFLCLSSNGTILYATTDYNIMRMNTLQGSASPTMLAGSTLKEYSDGVGTAARFNASTGIALSADESALFVADKGNHRIRRLSISTASVTTTAGNGDVGSSNGPAARSTFDDIWGTKWYCNATSLLCGVLVADVSKVRFVSIEAIPTPTTKITVSRTLLLSSETSLSRSPTSSTASSSQRLTSSKTLRSRTASGTSSVTKIAEATHSCTPTLASTVSSSMTTFLSHTATQHRLSMTPSSSTTRTPISSPSATDHCALLPTATGGALATLVTSTEESATHSAQTSHAILLAPVPTSSIVTGALTTEAVSRQALLGRYPLAANLSLTLGGTLRGVNDPADGWALVGVQLDVVAVDATFPLLTASAGFTVVSSSVAGRRQLLACVLHPPSATGWLPSTLGVLSTVTLRLRLTLRCPTDAAVTQDVVIVVPSPGQSVFLTAEVRAAGTAAQYSSSISGPAVGSAVGRLSAARSLVACDGSAAIGGLLPVAAVDGCEDGPIPQSNSAAGARGAVLGNAVLWAAGCALMALLTCGYSRCAAVSLRTAAEALGVPSPLLPLVVATVPSTVSSTFVLLRSSCAADRAVAAVGAVMTVCPIAVLCGLSLLVPHLLHLEAHEAHWSPAAVPAVLRTAVARLLHRRVRWVSRSSPQNICSARPLWLVRVAAVVLLEYAVVWYLCVDVAVLTLVGLLGAVGTLGSLAACRGSAVAVAVAVLYVGQLVLCAAVRPYTTLFSQIYTIFCHTLSAVSVWCQVWYLFASARGDADLDALGALLAVSAVCGIVVSAASMLRTLLDAVEALRACRRHVVVLNSRVDGSRMGSVSDVVRTPRMLCKDEEAPADVGDLLAEYDDAHFWRSDGSAAVVCASAAAVSAGVSTALEDMQQRHRGPAHELMLHFEDPALPG